MSNRSMVCMLLSAPSTRVVTLALATLLAATMSACDRRSTTTSTGTANHIVSDAGDLEGGAIIVSPCDLVEREQAAALAKIPVCPGSHAGTADPLGSQSAFRTCLPTRDGAWGLVRESEHVDVQRYCAIREAVEFGMVGGRELAVRVRAAYARNGSLVKSREFSAVSFDPPRTFDYDGDGDAELLLSGVSPERFASMDDMLEKEQLRFGAIMRGVDGVREYVPAAGFDISGFQDVDGDGRPDLITTSFVDGDDGDVRSWTFLGPRLVAHSLKGGTFSDSDAVASAWARRECRTVTLEHAHARGLFRAALCTRLLGASPTEVSKRYAERCRALQAKSGRTPVDVVDDAVSLSAVCRVGTAPSSGPVGMPTVIASRMADVRSLAAPASFSP